ncbi:Protein daughter of sevenless [Trichuris trichiura]|uniref:Protein daughter of sevenless n=1 Tax=Trichuris trichiura TaxID=36087 RepID=A0A077ZBD4_TRITR|nr:Protein daughter of sevenless [Trichuris trichiura]
MLEVLREGWLTKSPPDWKFWNSKWKPRYFVLIADHSAGECSLKYYVDQEKTKLRGSINLDECIQVDANLTFDYKNRIRYQWIFDIRIPKRVYYLVATSEDDMNAWVNDLCCVCNLQRDQDPDYSETTAAASENDVLSADPHNWKRSRPAQSANRKLTDREPWCNGNEAGQPRTKVNQSNGFQGGRTVQGYIPLTDCISGPPRPKQSQHSIKSSEIPPKHPPPPLPAELTFRKTSENFKDNISSLPSSTQEASIGQDNNNSSCAYVQSEKPPPRPPKRGVQSVGNVYENEVNSDNAAPVFPFYDNPLPPFSLFSSLPRPVKVKTTSSSSQATTLKNGSTFGTVPRIPREKKSSLSPVDRTDRTSSSAMAGLSSLSDLSISSSGTGSSSINASTGASPPPPPAQTDYYCFGVKTQEEPTIGDRAGEAKPPEVRRELKPGRLTSGQMNLKQAQVVPSSLDVQPYLPYRLSREPGGSKAVVKPHPDGPSLDLSRKVSFSKKKAALQEAAKVMPKTTYASVVNVPALRDCSARLHSLSEAETEDPIKGSNDSIHQMEYVEVGKTAQISPSPSPVPSPAGVQQQVSATGPPKTSYVVISQEKTQALMKTKSEQDHMYKTGTLERNKLGSVMTTSPKKL